MAIAIICSEQDGCQVGRVFEVYCFWLFFYRYLLILFLVLLLPFIYVNGVPDEVPMIFLFGVEEEEL